MATTTSNFGWDIPQSTDLVKDGATAIATLGQDIDTSMADLKGGTTGQILSKASGTDMDFTWTDANPGDITGVTAGTGLTGGGTSGSVTLDFDVANYGGGQYAAGKNKLINGNFNIWQRGTSFTNPSNTYTADRWACSGNANTTISRESTIVAPGNTYSLKVAQVTNTTNIYVGQAIETANAIALAGKTVTFSIKVASSASVAMSLQLYYSTSVDNGPLGSWTQITASSGGTVTPTSSTFVTGTATFVVPSTAKSIYPLVFYSATAGLNTYFDEGQLEIGSTATPFQLAAGNAQGELAACQRYYWRETASTTYSNFGTGYWDVGNGKSQFNIPMPVTMRIAPTSVEYSTLMAWDGSAVVAITALTIGNTTKSLLQVTATQATGGTAYRFMVIGANNSTSAYIAASAEL